LRLVPCPSQGLKKRVPIKQGKKKNTVLVNCQYGQKGWRSSPWGHIGNRKKETYTYRGTRVSEGVECVIRKIKTSYLLKVGSWAKKKKEGQEKIGQFEKRVRGCGTRGSQGGGSEG